MTTEPGCSSAIPASSPKVHPPATRSAHATLPGMRATGSQPNLGVLPRLEASTPREKTTCYGVIGDNDHRWHVGSL
jgi:hypothetical protein